MWKICTKCKKHKALWEFCNKANYALDLNSECRVCDGKRSKKWKLENRVIKQKKDKKYYNSNRTNQIKWSKKRRAKNAKYKYVAHRLTVEESPRLAKDNISVEVKCRNCRQYFIPNNSQVEARIRAINTLEGRENNIYCSEECKQACPVFHKSAIIPNNTLREPIPQELRDEILQRNDGMCEMCGEHPSKEVHHEKPVATHPHLQLDKDNLWGLCKYCHYEVCHQLEGCTLAELRKRSVNTMCNRT
jgi:hypothetical protein